MNSKVFILLITLFFSFNLHSKTKSKNITSNYSPEEIYSQNSNYNISKNHKIHTKTNNIKEAVDFLNLFLNHETWMTIDEGGFTYNSYSNSLVYKHKTTIKDDENTTIEVEYLLNLDNVKSINETIHIKPGDPNIIIFEIILKNEIFKKNHTKEKGAIIPDYKNSKTNKVHINITKSLTEQDLESLRRAIRDIFLNIPIETQYK